MYWHPALVEVSERPRHHPRQRILRRAAGPSGGEDRTRLARAPDRDRPRRQARLHGRARPDPAIRPAAAAGAARGARRDRSSNGAPTRGDGTRPAARARRRRRAGDRLRPCRERRRRHLAGGRPARLCRSAERARQHRSHRACRFPGAGAGGRGHGRGGFGPIAQAEFLRRLGIETRAASLKAQSRRPPRLPRSTPRWRA